MARQRHESTGIGSIDDRDRSDPDPKVLREDGTDVECGLARSRELPVDEQHTGPAPRAGCRDDQEIVPSEITVHQSRVGAGGAHLLQAVAQILARLHATDDVTRADAQVE